MSLAQLFADQFRGDIRIRGQEFIKKERVSITRVTADEIAAVVQDTTEFLTQLIRDNGDLRLVCACQTSERPNIKCKHLWATLLAVDSGGLIQSPVRPGSIPPFVAEVQVDVPLTEVWDDDRRDVYVPPSRPKLAPEVLVVQPQLKSWEVKLQQLSIDLQGPALDDKPHAKEREVFYEIDASQSRDRRLLVVQTSQCQRRANGQWGKRKPLKLKPGQLDDVDLDDDRRILAHLAGGIAERSHWYAQQVDMQANVHRYQVPWELANIVLPLMCATGRTRLLVENSQDVGPITWDDGPPWELALHVVPNEDDTQWMLEAHLVRGVESIPLREIPLILPGGFIFHKEQVARLQDFGSFEWIELLRGDSRLEVPKDDGHELVDRLLDLPQLPQLQLPLELRLEEIRATPVPHLTLHTPRGIRWQQERLHGEITFEYEGTRIRGASPQGAIVQRELGRCILRDRSQEDASWADLEQLGFRRLKSTHQRRFDIEIPAKSLGPAVRGLIKLGWQIHADGQQVHQPGLLQFEIKSGIDWFELHAKVDFEGRTVGFPELLSALARGDATVKLNDGSLGIIPEEWFRKFGLLSGLGTAEEDHVRFAQNQVGLLDALLATRETVFVDAGFEELRQRVQSFQGIHTSVEPKGFSGELRGYQREGFGWLRFLQDFKFGGCLADDMGLGKTIQLLALLQDRRLQHPDQHRPSLVVVPKSLLFNWHAECRKFTPNLKVLEYTGLQRTSLRKKFAKADVILTTYGTIRRDILHLKEIKFDYIVLDEAQAIKNAGSQVAKATRLLQGEYRLALTGTPIENRLGDLWSIFEFLNPGMLGRASIFKMHTAEATNDQESRKVLASALRPFILRRTKKEVARDLPEKLEQTILCTMSKQQDVLYQELREHYRQTLLGIVQKQGLAKSKIHVLEALLRLRQAACHPALLDPKRIEEPSAKLDLLTLQLQDLIAEGHKALVFSQFTSMLAIVKHHLDQKGIVYEYLDGQTRHRKEAVEHFQSDPNCGVFLISLKAGGLGLNLTAADYVFLLDPWWNPAVEMQAIDRAHRLGQTRQVFAYRLICRNTVEEKIAELQLRKKDLADAILEADNNLIQDLTAEDLELLLS